MTTETKLADLVETVAQCDRDAARVIHRKLGEHSRKIAYEGWKDDSTLVQAFAAHRIATEEALKAENEKLREALRGFVNDLTGSLKNRSAMLTINHAALVARIEQASKILETSANKISNPPTKAIEALLHIVAIANTRDIEATEAGFKVSKAAVHVPYELIDKARTALEPKP